tara:strand:- start:12524 stop:12700 length:177 start_codon:yes stop_codon:yes gene_type:complete
MSISLVQQKNDGFGKKVFRLPSAATDASREGGLKTISGQSFPNGFRERKKAWPLNGKT